MGLLTAHRFSSGASAFGNYAGAVCYRYTSAGNQSVNTVLNFLNDGTVTCTGTRTDGSTGLPSNWFLPTTASIGSSYWVRATRVSGDVTGFTGTLGSWLALSTTRQFSYNATAGTVVSGVYLFEISSSSGGSPIVYSGNVTITSEGV